MSSPPFRGGSVSIDGIEWQGTALNVIHMEEGRILPSGTYHYVLRDHLGNTRSGFSSGGFSSGGFVCKGDEAIMGSFLTAHDGRLECHGNREHPGKSEEHTSELQSQN